jgi:hypothetical protein
MSLSKRDVVWRGGGQRGGRILWKIWRLIGHATFLDRSALWVSSSATGDR